MVATVRKLHLPQEVIDLPEGQRPETLTPDLNPIKHLWRNLKTAAGTRHPSNLNDLEQFAKEDPKNHSWL